MTNTSAELKQQPVASARLFWMKLVRWILFAILVIFATAQIQHLWANAQLETLTVHPGLLLLAGLVYLIGWLPAAFFWRQLLLDAGQQAPWSAMIAAHYCGHLGKYVPGKAMAILIRADLLKAYTCKFGITCATAVIETLASMAVGLGWGLLLLPACFSTLAEKTDVFETLPQVLPWQWLVDHRWEMIAVIAVCLMCGIPILLHLTLKLSAKFAPQSSDNDSRTPLRISLTTFSVGLVILSVGWWIHGLSLWLVLHGLGADQLSISAWPLCTASSALATSIGFAALFAPGGLIVREAILTATLQPWPEIGTKQAIAAGVVLRLVWVVFELIACGVLYWLVKKGTTQVATSSDDSTHLINQSE